jgi:hypothetical protein
MAQGDYDAAEDFTYRALAMDPASLYANLFLPMIAVYRADASQFTRTLTQGRATVGDDPMFLAYEALHLAKSGRRVKAGTQSGRH